jgi:hypothetical protein
MISMAVGVAVTHLVHRGEPACEEAARRGRTGRCGAKPAGLGVQVLAFSLSYWFFSVNRATLLWFPLWILLGRWVTGPSNSPRLHRVLVGCAFGLEIVLMLWWSWLFFTGHWAS